MIQRQDLQTRPVWAALVLLLIFLVLIGRLVYLQVARGPYYARMASATFLQQIPIPAPRGKIVDSRGQVVASDRISWAVYAMENGKPLSASEVRQLGNYLGMSPAQVQAAIRKNGQGLPAYEPVLVQTNLTAGQFTAVSAHKDTLPGIRLQAIPVRSYLYDHIGAQVLGYLNTISPSQYARLQTQGYHMNSMIGQSGVEATYQQYLRGKAGAYLAQVNRLGQLKRIYSSVSPTPGDTVHLTIHWQLEQVAQNALGYVMHVIQTSPVTHSAQATSGSVVVMNVHTGAILAMASLPAFNPNRFVTGLSPQTAQKYFGTNPSPTMNWNIQGSFAPGSTFKPLMALGALADGIITPQTTLFDGGVFPKDHQFTNWYPPGFGWVNVVRAIAYSDDVFFYWVGYWMHLARMQQWMRYFGLNHRTHIDLPGEVRGTMPSKSLIQKLEGIPWTWGQDLNTVIGQGLNMYTPIEMVRATAAIANGGTLLWPHVVSRITSADGRTVLVNKPRVQGHVPASQSAFQTVWQGQMGSAQFSSPFMGTGYEALRGFPLSLASKTGTSQIPPAHSVYNAFFETYGPMPHPQIAIFVYIHRGVFGAYSGFVARAIYDQYFQVKDPQAKSAFDAIFGNYPWPFGYHAPGQKRKTTVSKPASRTRVTGGAPGLANYP